MGRLHAHALFICYSHDHQRTIESGVEHQAQAAARIAELEAAVHQLASALPQHMRSKVPALAASSSAPQLQHGSASTTTTARTPTAAGTRANKRSKNHNNNNNNSPTGARLKKRLRHVKPRVAIPNVRRGRELYGKAKPAISGLPGAFGRGDPSAPSKARLILAKHA